MKPFGSLAWHNTWVLCVQQPLSGLNSNHSTSLLCVESSQGEKTWVRSMERSPRGASCVCLASRILVPLPSTPSSYQTNPRGSKLWILASSYQGDTKTTPHFLLIHKWICIQCVCMDRCVWCWKVSSFCSTATHWSGLFPSRCYAFLVSQDCASCLCSLSI